MKKLFISLILVLFATTSLAVSGNDASQELVTLLSDFQTMTANFTQTSYDAKNHPLQTTSGEMALSRPGKFRWQVVKPNQQLLIADGKYLWIYDVDLAQVTRQPMDASKAGSPASLLSGSTADLQKRFTVTRVPGDTETRFKLTPNNTNDLFRWIQLSFTAGKLTQMRMADNLGSISVLNFSQVQTNAKLANKLFQFKTPKGVEVIQN